MAYIALIRAMEATLHSRHYSSKLDLRVVIVNWNIRVNQDYLHMSVTSRAYYIDSCGSIEVNATTYLYICMGSAHRVCFLSMVLGLLYTDVQCSTV